MEFSLEREFLKKNVITVMKEVLEKDVEERNVIDKRLLKEYLSPLEFFKKR